MLLLAYGEEERRQRALAPVEESRECAMMLHQEHPFPLVAKRRIQVRDGVLHEPLD